MTSIPAHTPLERLHRSGIQYGGGGIPWQVATTSYPMTPRQADTLGQLTHDSFRFLSIVAGLLAQNDDISRSLVATLGGSPNRLEVARHSFAQPGLQLGMVRPDVILSPTHGYSIVEIETMIGGLGTASALRWAYQTRGFEGIAPAYAKMIRLFFAQHGQRTRSVLNKDVLTVGVINPAAKSGYDGEFLVFARHLQPLGINLILGRPEELRASGGSVYLNDQPTDVIHRFFRLSELQPPQVALLTQILKRHYVPMVQPWVEPLEDKALFALFHEPSLEKLWVNHLGRDAFNRLKQAIPMTWLVGGANGDLMRELYNRPRDQRRFWIKKSSDSWGGRGAFLGSELSNTKWTELLAQAYAGYLRGEVWIVQPHRPATVDKLSCIDPKTGNVTTKEMFHRISPFGLYTGDDQITLADIMVTARPNPKVHGATDATMVAVNVER